MTSNNARSNSPEIALSTGCVIAGRSVEAAAGATFDTINPANGQVLAAVSRGQAADIDNAVAAARKAFDNGPWPRMTPAERKTILLRFASVIEANTDELALMEAMDAGKPITDCMDIDLPETVNTLRWHAEAADKIYDQLSPSGNGVVSMIVREPIGVVGAVLPWNFPLMMAAWKLGPLLASGNTCVLKPAEQSPLTTIRLAELATEAGIPDGVINVVPGLGEEAGRALGLHPGVDCVGFTGSTSTGREFLRYAADSNMKRVLLECGGKNPMLVMADVEDLDTVAEHAVNAAFWNMGENCSATSRLIVHQSLADELHERICTLAHDWVVGDPLNPATRVGPLIEASHLQRVQGFVDKADGQGASLLRGGKQILKETGGFYFEPTLFADVSRESDLFCHEIFGPVLSTTTFSHPEEAIELANSTEYGLAASVFTNSNKTAHNAARAIKAGTVTVNCYGEGDISTPFGGYKHSGFGGRDKSLAAHDQYTETKTVWLDLS